MFYASINDSEYCSKMFPQLNLHSEHSFHSCKNYGVERGMLGDVPILTHFVLSNLSTLTTYHQQESVISQTLYL